MKIFFTLLFTVFSLFFCAAKYQIESTSNLYKPLEKPTLYLKEAKPFELGFHCKVMDQYYNQIKSIDEYGRVYFINDGDAKMNFISAAGFKTAQHISSPNQKIQYEVTGKEGNRIFKIEWQNILYKLKNGKEIAMNYQIWLYEMGFFEIHYGPNSKNSMIESSSIIGLGQCNTKQKGHKYKLSIEKGPFAAQLSQDLSTLRYFPTNGTVYVFNAQESYEINTLINYNKNQKAIIDLYVTMENPHTVSLSIDDEQGNTVYAEQINNPTLYIARNLSLAIGKSHKCYLNIETTEKVFIKPISFD